MEQKKSSEKPKDERVRNVCMVLYEDSATPNWKTLLEDDHIPYMYAYHDKDINPTGEPKKPHTHLILCFEGKKSPEQIQYYADRYGAANSHWQAVASIRAMARYLTHMDNPDKVQYDGSIVHSCACDYNAIVEMASNRYKAIEDMIDFIEAEDIILFAELFYYAKLHKFDWYKCLCDNSAYVIREYIKSRAYAQEHSLQNRYTVKIDSETGEVIK